MTNEQIAARLREIASNLPNVADSEPICSALHEVATELEAQPAGDAGMRMCDATRSFIEGMSVSVDVSTGDHDAGNRYFGTVTEVMDAPDEKYRVILLVQNAEPNFDIQGRCQHGVRWPHECRECADAVPDEEIRRWVEHEHISKQAGDAGMPEIVQRVLRFSGKERREVSNPNITARETIKLANWMRDAQAAIAARDARIAEHASDGEMLDWLVRKGTMHVGGSDARGWMVSDMRNGLVALSRGHTTYRDAIRAAMKGTPS